MKLLHLTFKFEFWDQIERLLDRHDIGGFVRHAMVAGKDRDGKHYGTKVFPGASTVVQAQVPDDKVDRIMEDLSAFREEKEAHKHLEALILDVERRL
jgi:hypothetical protein